MNNEVKALLDEILVAARELCWHDDPAVVKRLEVGLQAYDKYLLEQNSPRTRGSDSATRNDNFVVRFCSTLPTGLE